MDRRLGGVIVNVDRMKIFLLGKPFILLFGALSVFLGGLVIGIKFGDQGEISESEKKKGMVTVITRSYSKKLLPLSDPKVESHRKTIEMTEVKSVPELRGSLSTVTRRNNRDKWLDNAVPFSLDGRSPLVAIVLDDMGLDRYRSETAVALPSPLTLSYISYARDLLEQTKTAVDQGHELLVHLPMEPEGNANPGPGALMVNMTEKQLQARLTHSLGRFSNFVGVNNHMGSLFTSDQRSMEVVLSYLNERGYLFLDSVTTSRSVAIKLGHNLEMPIVARDVFLDDIDSENEVASRLKELERIAADTGTAIAIGHPRQATLSVLSVWLSDLPTKNLKLAPLTAIARVRLGRKQKTLARQ
tara:strand:- start:224 stop:1294 length:1071 start_codon:yes stop_codon:yes gene_type:complete